MLMNRDFKGFKQGELVDLKKTPRKYKMYDKVVYNNPDSMYGGLVGIVVDFDEKLGMYIVLIEGLKARFGSLERYLSLVPIE